MFCNHHRETFIDIPGLEDLLKRLHDQLQLANSSPQGFDPEKKTTISQMKACLRHMWQQHGLGRCSGKEAAPS